MKKSTDYQRGFAHGVQGYDALEDQSCDYYEGYAAAMLLAAAKHMATERNFDGTV